MRYLFALEQADKSAHVETPGRDWILEHRGVEFCDYCNKVNRSQYPRGVDVVLSLAGGMPSVGRQHTLCIGLISAHLRNALGKWMDDFAFGMCYDRNGTFIGNCSTFYHGTYVIPVSNEQFVCPRCGTVTAHWSEPPRLHHEGVGSRLIVEEATNLLYISEEVYESVNWQDFPDIDLIECEVAGS